MVAKVARLHFQPAGPAGALHAISGWLIVLAGRALLAAEAASGLDHFTLPLAGALAGGAMLGLMEPIAAIAGAMMVSTSAAILPWGLAGAAGAMLFVVSHEIIPETHRHGHETLSTGGLIAGFVAMMLMDAVLG